MPKYNDFDLDVQNLSVKTSMLNTLTRTCDESSVRPPTDYNRDMTQYCSTMWCTERCSSDDLF